MFWNEVAGTVSDGLRLAEGSCLGVSQLQRTPGVGTWVVRTQAGDGFWSELYDRHGEPTLHARLLPFPEGETYILVTLGVNDWRHDIVMPAGLEEVRGWLEQVRTTGVVCLEVCVRNTDRTRMVCQQVDTEFLTVIGAAGGSPDGWKGMKHYLFVIAAIAAAAESSWLMATTGTRGRAGQCDSVAPVVPLALEITQEAAGQALLLIHQF